ncbi:hypothetical protein GOP47_0009994 [Adiantum capillus-veneris]|uniref:Uncharacterized protein n=1 Tax=Adiantum capillus-veneris TaxID=13818 RepID=A0A9D4UYH2_ADICA|nr:hypothetical protein GOP47_0009994 [Adiantum capillus-veneris]
MHSLLLPPRSIIASFSKQKYANFFSHCEQSKQFQGLGFNEMLGNPDANAGESSDTVHAVSAEEEASTSSRLADALTHASLEDLVVECALAVVDAKWQRSVQLINHLRQRTSPEGDSLDRVVTHFVDSLTARVVSELGESQVTDQLLLRQPWLPLNITDAERQGAYLSLNQVTPFIRFTHLTANQAILEVFQGWDSVHIVDMDIMQGVQWPPLMQALAGRAGGAPRIRISGAGSNFSLLEQTGNLLATFAVSLGLAMFEFHPLHAEEHNIVEILSPSSLDLRAGDALAINMSIPQPRLSSRDRGSFVTMVRSLDPTIVTLADREVNCRQGSMMETFNHYRALFDSLEATLPPSSLERSNVERVWLRGEIVSLFSVSNSTGGDGSRTSTDFQCFNWKETMRNEGFLSVSHSPFAVSQARLLLRLHYPSQGYQLREEDGDSLLLGWQGTPLFGVSAWRV